MKLPEFTKDNYDSFDVESGILRSHDLAQLHIQRSIAVSLELIAICLIGDNKQIHDQVKAGNLAQAKDGMGAMMRAIWAHSVKDSPNDQT